MTRTQALGVHPNLVAEPTTGSVVAQDPDSRGLPAHWFLAQRLLPKYVMDTTEEPNSGFRSLITRRVRPSQSPLPGVPLPLRPVQFEQAVHFWIPMPGSVAVAEQPRRLAGLLIPYRPHVRAFWTTAPLVDEHCSFKSDHHDAFLCVPDGSNHDDADFRP